MPKDESGDEETETETETKGYIYRERASRVFVDLAKAWKFLESENKAEQVKEEEEQVNDG